jgi:GNAT superfamily N-acetyltransferase
MNLTYRKACIDDLNVIVSLLAQDQLGQSREQIGDESDQRYTDAFHRISSDPNQYLVVACENKNIVATCHLTLMPSLTFIGSTRLQIEAVRVRSDFRGKGVGRKLIEFAIDWGALHGAKLFQLTTNKHREDALRFYETLGFQATHEGMKLYLERRNDG